MKNFDNNREADFKKLEERGIYSKALLQSLKKGEYNVLNSTEFKELKKDRDFMEPIFYAVKKEYDTYEIYRYYGKNIQEEIAKKDLELAINIAKSDITLIIGTPISENRAVILEVAKTNPKVITCMSSELKANTKFTEELCKIENKEVIMYAAKECKMPDTVIENPNLASNPVFMKEAIKEDASMISHVAEELKNNHEFMQEACKENKEVIDYVAEHTEEFGEEGLGAAKEVLVENTTSKAIDEMKTELATLQKEKVDSEEITNEHENVNKEKAIRERQLKNNIRFIEKIKNGEVKQERAVRLINSLCDNLSEDYRQELLKYVKMDDAIIEQQKAEKDVLKIEPKNIETISKEAQLSEIQAETTAIREEIIAEREEKVAEEKQTKENNELGEQ